MPRYLYTRAPARTAPPPPGTIVSETYGSAWIGVDRVPVLQSAPARRAPAARVAHRRLGKKSLSHAVNGHLACARKVQHEKDEPLCQARGPCRMG